VRLKEPIAARRQGTRRGRGAGNTVPRPLTPGRYRLLSRVSGENVGGWCMRSCGFDRDEAPRGERDRGGRGRPSPDWSFHGVKGLRQGLMPEGSRRCWRLAASARKPRPEAQRREATCASRCRVDRLACIRGHCATSWGTQPPVPGLERLLMHYHDEVAPCLRKSSTQLKFTDKYGPGCRHT
jgi:hypothetical protein